MAFYNISVVLVRGWRKISAAFVGSQLDLEGLLPLC